MKKNEFYFSTRDLMMMAALAALGGITSTYVNMIGDFFQSLLGFAGTTQWAAGLHIIWLMLASALVGKPGAASLTGILKGGVELLSGNTHGILVVVIDIVAGLIVDFVLLLSKDKKSSILFYLAAGFSSASNVIVFQIFASLPTDVLAVTAILATSALAFGSGVIFGGFLTGSLIKALDRIGLVHHPNNVTNPRKKILAIILIIAAIVVTTTGGYLIYSNQTKVSSVSIGGMVNEPYAYPETNAQFHLVDIQIESNGAVREYSGVLLKDLIQAAGPIESGGVVLIEASDGYSFFVSMEEINSNPDLILTAQQSGNESVFNIVGAASSKAWVRGVARVYVMPKDTLEITGKVESPYTFSPQDWQDKMDSIYFAIEDDQVKLQGVPLNEIVLQAQPAETTYRIIVKASEEDVTLDAASIADSTDIRLFTYPKESGFEFILGEMNGTVLARHVERIEIQ